MQSHITTALATTVFSFFCIVLDCEGARKVSKPKFVQLQGKVLADGKAAKQHHFIPLNRPIEAKGEESYAQIRFPDGTLVRIVNGALTLLQSHGGHHGIRLIRGQLYVISLPGPRTKKVPSFQVELSQGLGPVKMREGSKLMATYRETTSLLVCKGEVELEVEARTQAQSPIKYRLKTGHHLVLRPPPPPLKKKKTPQKGKGEEEEGPQPASQDALEKANRVFAQMER